MAVFTLVIDIHSGFNTDLFFTGFLPTQWQGSGISGSSGSSSFRLLDDNGIASGPTYTTDVTGTGLNTGFDTRQSDHGISGLITSATMTRELINSTIEQVAHLNIALGSNTGLIGGVAIPGSSR